MPALRVTHNACGDVVDGYTHFDWAPLCEAVLCLRLPVRPAEVVALPLRAVGGEAVVPSEDPEPTRDTPPGTPQPRYAGLLSLDGG